jgi:hypothetical protein
MDLSLSRTHFLGVALLSLAAASAAAQGLMQTRGQVAAQTGDTPVGLPAGVTLGSTTTGVFDSPVIAASGAMLVRARLIGSVSTQDNRALILGHANGDMRVVLRAGDPEPTGTFPNSIVVQTGSTGQILGSGVFANPRIASSPTSPFIEYVMFSAMLYDTTLGNDGLTTSGANANNSVWYWGFPVPGGLQILARRAVTTMPDGAVLIVADMTHQGTSLGNNGTAVFKSTLSTSLGTPTPPVTTANDTAWIIGVPNALNYLIREGDSLPGGEVIGALGSNAILNEVGQVLHDETLSTTLGTPPATTADDRVLLVTTAGQHAVLVREGGQAVDASGLPTTGVFYGAPSLGQGFTAAGRAAFSSTLTGAVTTGNDQAVFFGAPGSLQMVLREGDAAPGVVNGELIGTPNINAVSASDYGVVVGTSLQGATPTTDSMLVLCQPGQPLVKIAREGDPAPGFPSGWVFGDLGGSTNFGSSSQGRINAFGQIMFSSMPVNDGTTVRSSTWSWDPTHGLQPQLVQGDTIGGKLVDFLPGTVLQFPGGEDSPAGFNNSGDFVMVSNTATDNFLARGHVGSFFATPSAVPVTGGVPQNFAIDCGPSQAFRFYVVLATSLGIRPGFVGPFGPQTIRLNPDPLWTDLSLNAANSTLWVNSIGLTDANGQGNAAFVMPAGYPGFQGTTLHHLAVILDFSLVQTFVTEPGELKLY